MKARFEIERKLIQEKKQLQKEKKKKKEVRQQKSHRRISLRAKRYGGKEDKTTKAIDELRANRTADKQRKAAEAEQQQHRREPLKASDVFSNSSEESSSDSSDDDDGDSSADEPGPGDRYSLSFTHPSPYFLLFIINIHEAAPLLWARFPYVKQLRTHR